jgi:hypothetical protein
MRDGAMIPCMEREQARLGPIVYVAAEIDKGRALGRQGERGRR